MHGSVSKVGNEGVVHVTARQKSATHTSEGLVALYPRACLVTVGTDVLALAPRDTAFLLVLDKAETANLALACHDRTYAVHDKAVHGVYVLLDVDDRKDKRSPRVSVKSLVQVLVHGVYCLSRSGLPVLYGTRLNLLLEFLEA